MTPISATKNIIYAFEPSTPLMVTEDSNTYGKK